MFSVLVLTFIIAVVAGSMAPGDDDKALCEQLRMVGAAPDLIPSYSANMRVLMDSWNYQNLLLPHAGAVWEQVDNDTNNPSGVTTNVSIKFIMMYWDGYNISPSA